MKFSTISKRLPVMAALVLGTAVFITPVAHAELQPQNVVQLVSTSQSIVAGMVSDVADGIDANGIPYTEVTIKVRNSVKGKIKLGEYTFRQFGLIKPRTMPNGQRLLSVTPADFPTWHADENVVVFLYHPAARTGLQTTTGLAQGKLVEINGKLSNEFNNKGLFKGVQASPGTLSSNEASLLKSAGPVDSDAFLGLLNHLVQDQLIQKGMVK